MTMSRKRIVRARAFVVAWAGVLAWTAVVWSAERGAAYLAALESIKAQEMQQHVNYLADEKREGREAGTQGGYAAGDYLRERLAALKLQPSGTDGAYQAFTPNYRNVLARLEGSDPKLHNDVIVLGAHYDHIGLGKKGNSLGQIGLVHPGADDNASGTSGLLELAQAFTVLGEAPRRTILFAFWDAEEKGMLGSKHWVAYPTIPIERVRLMVNLDMIGRLRNDRLLVFGTRSGYGLRRLISMHNESALRLEFSWNSLPNADHFPFFSHEVPFVFFNTDLHEQYHRPSDKADLINSSGMQRTIRMVFSLVYDLANADAVPAFRAAAHNESDQTRSTIAHQPPQLTDRLGATWSNESPERGVAVLDAPGLSPAYRAGLRPGDRIVQFAGRDIRALDELTSAIMMSPAQTSAMVLRPGESKASRVKIDLDGLPLRIGIVWRVDDAEPRTAILTAVMPGSPGARAGLQADDRIYQVNGRDFSGEDELARLLGDLPSPIRLTIERSGQLRSAELRIEATPVRRAA